MTVYLLFFEKANFFSAKTKGKQLFYEISFMKDFEILLEIAKRKAKIDTNNNWFFGSQTYLSEIKKEIDEVNTELSQNRICYLEDELGDVLWDYINALVALEKERGISVENVLGRACKKYEERIRGIENGELWNDVKKRQKIALAEEQKHFFE